MIVIKSKDEEKKKTPHLALTHEAQGGPANGRKVSLIMKGVNELTPEQKESLTAFMKSQNPSEEIEKASYQSIYRALGDAVDEYVKDIDRWGWAYVRDFDDSFVIFSNGDGVYAAEYSVDGNSIELNENSVIPVNEMISWEDESGNIIVSQSDSISSNVANLVMKSFKTPKVDDEKIKEIFKSKYMEGKEMDELKAQVETLQAEVKKSADLLEASSKLVEELKAVIKQRDEADAAKRSADRLEVLKSVVAETELEAIHKSLESLENDAFDVIVKSMKATKEAAEEASGMFKQISKSKGVTNEEKTSDLDVLKNLLEAKNK